MVGSGQWPGGRPSAARLQPDVVVMGIRMPVMDGVEATGRLIRGSAVGDAAVLVLTMFDRRARRRGPARRRSGFLLKDVTPADFVAAIRVVASGEALIAPSPTRRLLAPFAQVASPPTPAGGSSASSPSGARGPGARGQGQSTGDRRLPRARGADGEDHVSHLLLSSTCATGPSSSSSLTNRGSSGPASGRRGLPSALRRGTRSALRARRHAGRRRLRVACRFPTRAVDVRRGSAIHSRRPKRPSSVGDPRREDP